MPVAWEDPRRRKRTLIDRLPEETRKISHSYSGIWRNGNRRAPSFRETPKEEVQKQGAMLQLQGVQSLCEGMSERGQQSKQTRWHEEEPQPYHLLHMQATRTLFVSMHRGKYFKTSVNWDN
jgi:hypothetical protein